MYKKRYQRLTRAMCDLGIDVLVATSPANVFYCAGFRSVGQQVVRATQVYAVFFKGETEPWVVIPAADFPSAWETGLDADRTVTYGRFFFEERSTCVPQGLDRYPTLENFATPGSALLHVLRHQVRRGDRVGLERGNLAESAWLELQELQTEYLDGSAALFAAREVKGPEEVEALRQAARIAETSMFATLQELEPGMTERAARAKFEQRVIEAGAEPLFAVFTFGQRSAFVDTSATGRPLRRGDIIRCDLGCTYDGYQSDLARTAVWGEAGSKLETYYSAVVAGEEAALAAARPGFPVSELFGKAETGTREAGLPHYRRHHCGHGIGLEVYEPPTVNSGASAVLRTGMVLCIETPYYELGWGGVQVEDTILITGSGCERLSKSDRSLVRLG